MLVPDKLQQTVIMADRLFPTQIDIDYHTYRLAMVRFFKEVKKLSPQNRSKYFFENYYSENGVSWAINRGIRYFTIVINQGTVMEERYYGQQIVNFNP